MNNLNSKIIAFFASENMTRKSTHLESDGDSAYVRSGWNEVCISAIDYQEKGKGNFKELLNEVERLEKNSRTIKIESIWNDRLADHLVKRGYTISGESRTARLFPE